MTNQTTAAGHFEAEPGFAHVREAAWNAREALIAARLASPQDGLYANPSWSDEQKAALRFLLGPCWSVTPAHVAVAVPILEAIAASGELARTTYSATTFAAEAVRHLRLAGACGDGPVATDAASGERVAHWPLECDG